MSRGRLAGRVKDPDWFGGAVKCVVGSDSEVVGSEGQCRGEKRRNAERVRGAEGDGTVLCRRRRRRLPSIRLPTRVRVCVCVFVRMACIYVRLPSSVCVDRPPAFSRDRALHVPNGVGWRAKKPLRVRRVSATATSSSASSTAARRFEAARVDGRQALRAFALRRRCRVRARVARWYARAYAVVRRHIRAAASHHAAIRRPVAGRLR